MTLLFLSDIAWDSLVQRPQHLASRMARTMRVLWIEPVTLGRRVLFTPVEIAPGLHRMTLPALPLNARNRWIRRVAALAARLPFIRGAAAQLQRVLLRSAVRAIGAAEGEIVCLAENFQFMQVARAVNPRRVVFDYIDDVFGFTTWPPYVRMEWRSALLRADAVTVTSATLRKRVLEAHSREVRIVPNGVEYSRFADPALTPRPPDLPPPGPPLVGYVGSVYPWLDFGLLDRTIGALGDLHFVVIGPVHPSVEPEIARLGRHRNFSFLGLKPYPEVPVYMRSLDAAIIPFRRTLLTEGVNPVKLYEYSAAGVPTVATDFSEDTNEFADLVLIARTEPEFLAHIRTAVSRRNDPDFTRKLRAFAAGNDWDGRAREFSSLLQPEGS